MIEPVGNLLLEHLKALRNELRDFRDEFHTETENVKHRMSALETAMIKVKREVTAGDETDARHQVQHDQIVERNRRLEKRLELTWRPMRIRCKPTLAPAESPYARPM